MSEIDNESTSQSLISHLTKDIDLLNSECNLISNTDLSASSDYCSVADCLNSNKKQDSDLSLGYDNKAYCLPVLSDSLQNIPESSDSNEAVEKPIPESSLNFNENTTDGDASNLNHKISDDGNFEMKGSEFVSNHSDVQNDILRSEEKITKSEDEREKGKQSVDETSNEMKALQLTDFSEVETSNEMKALPLTDCSEVETSNEMKALQLTDCSEVETSNEMKAVQLTDCSEVEKIIIIRISDDEHASGKESVDETSDEIKEFQLADSCDIEKISEIVAGDEHKYEKLNVNETSGEMKEHQLTDSCKTEEITETVAQVEHESRKQNAEEKSDKIKALQLRQNGEIEKILEIFAEEEHASKNQSVNETSDKLKALQLPDNCEMKNATEAIAEDEYENGEQSVDKTSDEMNVLKLIDNWEILSMIPRKDNTTNNGKEPEVLNLRTDGKVRCPESCYRYSSEGQNKSSELQALENQILPDDLNIRNLHIPDQLENVSDEKYFDQKHDDITKFNLQDNQLNPKYLSNPQTDNSGQSVKQNYKNALKYFQNLCDQVPSTTHEQTSETSEGYFQIRKQRNRCTELVTDIQNIKRHLADVKSDIGELKTRCAQVKNDLKDMTKN